MIFHQFIETYKQKLFYHQGHLMKIILGFYNEDNLWTYTFRENVK